MIEVNEVPLDPEIKKFQDEWAANAYQREYDNITAIRQSEYARLADPIFMQYQRGEATKEEWLAAVQAVKDANPYPVKAE
jgi:hypothetical protein